MSKLDIVLSTFVAGAISVFGLALIFFEIVLPFLQSSTPKAMETVFSLGFFASGVGLLLYLRRRTRSSLWASYANLCFWIFLLEVVFNVEPLILGELPGWRHFLSLIAAFILTLAFGYLSYRNRRRCSS